MKVLGSFRSDNGTLEMLGTESWSCTSTLDSDLIGRARRVLGVPCKCLPLLPCPQSWQLAGSWLLPTALLLWGCRELWHRAALRPSLGIPSASVPPAARCALGQEGRRAVCATPCSPSTGAVPAGGEPRSRWSLEAISAKEIVTNSS